MQKTIINIRKLVKFSKTYFNKLLIIAATINFAA